MADQADERSRYRAQALTARAALSPAQRRQASERIARYALSIPAVREARTIAVYLALPGEVSTAPLLRHLRRLHPPPRLAAPVILPDRQLTMYPLDDQAVCTRGPFGVRQPPTAGALPLSLPELDVVIVPGVAFDRAGRRLGWGAGYYDRFLAPLREQKAAGTYVPAASFRLRRPLLVGLAFTCQVFPELPAAPHDVPVDVVVTEDGVFPRA